MVSAGADWWAGNFEDFDSKALYSRDKVTINKVL